jgi:pimeloyl-ACP methyl ester carboxylesterase
MRIMVCVIVALFVLAAAAPTMAAVKCEYLDVQGWAEPNTPAEHNKLAVLRYWDDAKPATAAGIFIPGNGGGAPSFDIIGRWLVANAGMEVWAIDRRSNHLEDHTGTDMALKDGDLMMGGMYYAGGQFKQLTATDVPYLKYWGLPTHLNDIGEVVKQIQARGIKDIFLGGHSLGAMMTQAYGAYELPDGRPAYKDLRGLILFDGSVFGSRSSDIDQRIAEVDKQINDGQLFPKEFPQAGAISEFIIIAANLDPEGLSQLASLPPVQQQTGVSSPMTNLALFGVALDTDYKFHALCRCGKLADADPKKPGEALEWIPYDKCGEVTDAVALSKALVVGKGATEWYQPLALVRDMGKASQAMLDLPEMGFKYQKEMDLPVIAFLANASGYGFAPGLKEYVGTIKGTAEVHAIDPPGTYAHLDPIVAADADKRVFEPLKEWMGKAVAPK